eukprot:CAMPEP_0196595536 /NCGR_PEP_ID=MMETSP1081-20130531/81342_1 /TAXON_ID=36882 /ORGANISM="Pyramimonas amylifera, Strain CCMP720" /LENGTH=147 /DNA_ID=CAMNT_0041920145 /DNA_START=130 /DNA_END=573 /DNA_ORIENTATION=+
MTQKTFTILSKTVSNSRSKLHHNFPRKLNKTHKKKVVPRAASSHGKAGTRANPSDELSPGAGLDTAEAQADAAFADLMFTSMAFQEGAETEEERDAAWEECLNIAQEGDQQEDWKNSKSKRAVQDVLSLFNALKGGAHIVKQKDGRV